MSRRSPDGTRKIRGRYYILAGRGTKAHCQDAAAKLRARGEYVRILPWNPFHDKALIALLDDYAVFTFPKESYVAAPKPRLTSR